MDTTRNETRSDALREQNLREDQWTYEEPDALTIPEVVKARYDNEGMALRWLRISLKGQDDITNVGKKQQAGWILHSQNRCLCLPPRGAFPPHISGP